MTASVSYYSVRRNAQGGPDIEWGKSDALDAGRASFGPDQWGDLSHLTRLLTEHGYREVR